VAFVLGPARRRSPAVPHAFSNNLQRRHTRARRGNANPGSQVLFEKIDAVRRAGLFDDGDRARAAWPERDVTPLSKRLNRAVHVAFRFNTEGRHHLREARRVPMLRDVGAEKRKRLGLNGSETDHDAT